mmetsp:Transcript_6479/g.23052  ORF Transcript_6479/g.23052 Transcript_6479/m.23052 type:complete len:295 (-) Transcript_6479:73-957(-)
MQKTHGQRVELSHRMTGNEAATDLSRPLDPAKHERQFSPPKNVEHPIYVTVRPCGVQDENKAESMQKHHVDEMIRRHKMLLQHLEYSKMVSADETEEHTAIIASLHMKLAELQETAEALSISRSDVQFTASSPISWSSVATSERESKKKISFSDEISDARSPDSDRTLKTTWESSPDQISPPALFTHDPFEHGLKQRTATQTFHSSRDRDTNESQSRSSIIYSHVCLDDILESQDPQEIEMQKILQEIEFLDKKLTAKNKSISAETSKTSQNRKRGGVPREFRDILTPRCKPWK